MSTFRALATASILAVVTMTATGCGGAERVTVQGPALTKSPVGRPAYVSDTMGHPLAHPVTFGLTEFTSLSRLKWRDWGRPKAVATGAVGGTWCFPECEGSGYPATIELTGLVHREAVAYYSRATVRSPKLPPEQAAELRAVSLIVPEAWREGGER